MALKVFGGLTMVKGKQVRTIVAASSQKKAAELVGVSLSYLRGYWSETGNAVELKTALSQPGVVFTALPENDKQFAPVSTSV
ncbi:hypothetical protein [Pseudomonas sp. NPDC089569]|uniref:hypothetical protein n=1 Tax=Pseudomonas sp. NPDC089569 TaxID=3390722 RepID=UPI003D02854E